MENPHITEYLSFRRWHNLWRSDSEVSSPRWQNRYRHLSGVDRTVGNPGGYQKLFRRYIQPTGPGRLQRRLIRWHRDLPGYIRPLGDPGVNQGPTMASLGMSRWLGRPWSFMEDALGAAFSGTVDSSCWPYIF